MVVGATGEPAPDHDAAAVARVLRDGGHEVVWTGALHSPEQVAETALQEDADLVCLVVADGTEGASERLAQLLARRGAGEVGVRVLPAPVSAGEVGDWVRSEMARGDG